MHSANSETEYNSSTFSVRLEAHSPSFGTNALSVYTMHVFTSCSVSAFTDDIDDIEQKWKYSKAFEKTICFDY